MKNRPLPVTIIACIYVATGAIGFAYHATEFRVERAFQDDFVWIELVRLTAIVCGVYMLRGSNWARWLALAWIAFHVILSIGHSWSQFAMHTLLCAVFGYFLFSPRATQYFRAAGIRAT